MAHALCADTGSLMDAATYIVRDAEMISPNTPRPELGGRTPQQVSDSTDVAAICFGGIVACLLLAGVWFVVRAIWGMI